MFFSWAVAEQDTELSRPISRLAIQGEVNGLSCECFHRLLILGRNVKTANLGKRLKYCVC